MDPFHQKPVLWSGQQERFKLSPVKIKQQTMNQISSSWKVTLDNDKYIWRHSSVLEELIRSIRGQLQFEASNLALNICNEGKESE